MKAGKTRKLSNKAPPWPGIKRLGAPGRVRPPPGRTPLHRLKTRGVRCSCPINQEVQSSLASPRGRTRPSVARGCWLARRASLQSKGPLYPIRTRQRAGPRPAARQAIALAIEDRKPPAIEDALLPSQEAPRQMYLPQKPRGSTVPGRPPRSDAHLHCAGRNGRTKGEVTATPPIPSRAESWLMQG